jgi:translation initiation factor IF-3
LKQSPYSKNFKNLDRQKNRYHINQEIRSPEVRVIDGNGNPIGIRSRYEALQIAEARNLDLVEIAPTANPPVCKIIDYGKFVYELQKREKTQKKAQTNQMLKEVRFKWRTDTHDLDFKTKHARTFIEEGNKVKAMVTFRGREITHPEVGEDLLNRFVEALKDIAKVDQAIRLDSKHMTVVLSPLKSKSQKKAAASASATQEELDEPQTETL